MQFVNGIIYIVQYLISVSFFGTIFQVLVPVPDAVTPIAARDHSLKLRPTMLQNIY